MNDAEYDDLFHSLFVSHQQAYSPLGQALRDIHRDAGEPLAALGVAPLLLAPHVSPLVITSSPLSNVTSSPDTQGPSRTPQTQGWWLVASGDCTLLHVKIRSDILIR